MNKTLLFLIFVVILLCWKFVFTEKKVGLTDQAWVLQGLSNALTHKNTITAYWNNRGTLPTVDDWKKEKTILVDLSQTIVDSIQVGEDGPGVISVHYRAKDGLESPSDIAGKKINLIPEAVDGKLEWKCVGTLPVNLLPGNCEKFTANE